MENDGAVPERTDSAFRDGVAQRETGDHKTARQAALAAHNVSAKKLEKFENFSRIKNF